MIQSISVKSKLIVPPNIRPQIDETLEGFADACNQILEIAKKEKCYNTTKLHHLVYKPVRAATGLKANHVCQAIRRVVGNSKASKQVHVFRPTSISLDVRTFKYVEDGQTVGITLKSGRVNFKLSIGGYQIALLRGQNLTSATLNKTRQGDYYINFVVEIDTPPTGKTPKVIGVDLGRRDIATTSSGKAWNGGKLQATCPNLTVNRRFKANALEALDEFSRGFLAESNDFRKISITPLAVSWLTKLGHLGLQLHLKT